MLKEFPAISRKLEEIIIMAEWTDEKKTQAIAIIDQINKVGSIEIVRYMQYNGSSIKYHSFSKRMWHR